MIDNEPTKSTILVTFKEGIKETKMREILNQFSDLSIYEIYTHFGTASVAVPKGEEQKWIAELQKLPEVEFALEDFAMHLID